LKWLYLIALQQINLNKRACAFICRRDTFKCSNALHDQSCCSYHHLFSSRGGFAYSLISGLCRVIISISLPVWAYTIRYFVIVLRYCCMITTIRIFHETKNSVIRFLTADKCEMRCVVCETNIPVDRLLIYYYLDR